MKRSDKQGESVSVICKFCGSDKGFRADGYVSCPASQNVRDIKRGAGGRLIVDYDYIDVDNFAARDMDIDGYECRECGAEAARLADLIGSPLTYAIGARVVCPDGMRGIVATADFARKVLTVEGWHEEFKFGEVHAEDPMVDPVLVA